MLSLLKNTKRHFMTGVSYMIPFVVAGGVLLALSVMLNGKAALPDQGFLKAMSVIGIAGLSLFIPILAGFIAYSMVEKPGIAPGAIGGYLANQMGAGFLGGMLAGIIAGLVVWMLLQIIARLKVPDFLRMVLPIFVIPLVGTFITGIAIYYVVGDPVAWIMKSLSIWLAGMQGASFVVLGIILGCMITFDMGGPVNKTAFFFAVALITTNPQLMAAVAVPVCTPPLGLALATFFFKGIFNDEEREAGKPAFVMGLIGISEGAIPFAAADPMRVIPANMFGGAVGSIISLWFGATNAAPWGGLIVLPIIGNPVGYVIAVICGSVATAIAVKVLKTLMKPKFKTEKELDISFD
ncbi:PTS fructose-like transporter subunit EIIC [Rahnella sp. Lac-M11]|jgi:fructose-specific PTS system IIC-like component|uniref:PTS fructose-like transporter subunit EIIC n=1 Tax=Rahnella contaminans TaxID=2703882 RepID=A0A6M2B3W7_9GAMM|nr:fructose-specific PTS transporter subunit EIIC [Rahnella contaminans]NGX87181.1 PTS fructose-like transporter subunit EIIC [Rahnella contaminans]